MKFFLFHSVLVFSFLCSWGQNASSTLSHSEIVVGETTTLSYSIPIKDNRIPKFFPEKKYIPYHLKFKSKNNSNEGNQVLEILSPFKEEIRDSGGRSIWVGSYTITAWDSGHFILESPLATIRKSTISMPAVQLKVSLQKEIQGKEIYDIKELFTEIPVEKFELKKFIRKNYGWILALIIFLGIFIFLKTKKSRKNSTLTIEPSLKESTLLAIDSLEKERLWEKQKLKEHYIQLSYILRSYLSARFEINLLEKTTGETKFLLQKKGNLSEDTIQSIEEILIQSDLVKFAKSSPQSSEILMHSELTRNIVIKTSETRNEHGI